MKTPINSTLDWIERFKTMNGKYPTGEEITAQLVMQLPKEREAIEQAYNDGEQNWHDAGNSRYSIQASEYFRNTFKD